MRVHMKVRTQEENEEAAGHQAQEALNEERIKSDCDAYRCGLSVCASRRQMTAAKLGSHHLQHR